jgi:hypothetical protein
MSRTKRPPGALRRTAAKARSPEPDLRRAIGARWAAYLHRMALGLDDADTVRELDAMAAALADLRASTMARLGL